MCVRERYTCERASQRLRTLVRRRGRREKETKNLAAGRRFRVSADNLEAGLGASDAFKQNIYAQVLNFVADGVSERCQRLIRALEARSGVSNTLTPEPYHLGDLV